MSFGTIQKHEYGDGCSMRPTIDLSVSKTFRVRDSSFASGNIVHHPHTHTHTAMRPILHYNQYCTSTLYYCNIYTHVCFISLYTHLHGRCLHVQIRALYGNRLQSKTTNKPKNILRQNIQQPKKNHTVFVSFCLQQIFSAMLFPWNTPLDTDTPKATRYTFVKKPPHEQLAGSSTQSMRTLTYIISRHLTAMQVNRSEQRVLQQS